MNAAGAVPVLVWPVWLRVLHWSLALSVIASFATHEGGGAWHERFGWCAVGVAVLRLLAGVLTRAPYARMAAWWHGPAATWRYLRALLAGRAPRHLGHNPLGSWMMWALLANVLACSFTGWLFTTDRFWGVAWVEDLHGALGHAFVPMVLLHVAGALLASRLHRENLVASMLHGRKRP